LLAFICCDVSIWFAGHVTGQLHDQQWTVPTGSTDFVYSGLVSTLRLHCQDPLPTSFWSVLICLVAHNLILLWINKMLI